MPIVSNSSPLIALEQIKNLDLLNELFGEILIPDAVVAEIAPTVRNRSWIRQQSPGTLLSDTLRPALGPGERAAISLAAEVKASTIILDDEPARRIAAQLKTRRGSTCRAIRSSSASSAMI